MGRLTREEFVAHLRDALVHLYHPSHLQNSPLATLLGVADKLDAALALRTALVEAIEALRPHATEPSSSRGWEIYEVLLCRYVQRLSQQVVADQLAVSPRQVRRLQSAGLESLADLLFNRYSLEKQQDSQPLAQVSEAKDEVATPDVLDELAWLRDVPLESSADLAEAISSALTLAQPLAKTLGVQLEAGPCEATLKLAVHSIALGQMLLTLLDAAMHSAGKGGRVWVSAQLSQSEVEVELEVVSTRLHIEPRGIAGTISASLSMAQQLAEACGCRLIVDPATPDCFRAIIALPTLKQFSVLVIDDNADTLQLLQRYTVGTRYHLIGLQDAEQALALAQKRPVQVIVLDVMMPEVDGWRILGQLKQHPSTAHIPVLVCTVLPQKALAQALGASGFIQKPVTRQSFLAALGAQLGLPDKGSS